MTMKRINANAKTTLSSRLSNYNQQLQLHRKVTEFHGKMTVNNAVENNLHWFLSSHVRKARHH